MGAESKIKKYLPEHGIQQKWLAEKINMDADKLNRAMNRKRRLSLDEYACICWALGVEINEFLEPHPPAWRKEEYGYDLR